MIEMAPLAKVFNKFIPGRAERMNTRLFDAAQRAADGADSDAWGKIRWLVTQGADIQAVNAEGKTVLGMLADAGLRGVVRRLVVDAGAHPDQGGPKGEPPIVLAAGAGDVDGVDALLNSAANLRAKDQNGHDAIAALLQGDAPDSQDAQSNQAECLKLLLARGMTLGPMDEFYIYKQRPNLASFAPNVETAMAMVEAAEKGDLGKLKEIFNTGAGPDLPCRFADNPPLYYAARDGNLAMIELLKQAGANPAEGPPPLLIAAKNGQRAAFEALLDMGANPNQKWPGGETVLDFARKSADAGMETFVSDLLAERAKVAPDVTTGEAVTPMRKLTLKSSKPA